MQDAFDGFAGFSLADQRGRDVALLRATTELFVLEPAHDRDEMQRYEELALHLLPRVPEHERAFVAERLAPRIDAPAAVMRLLARDAIGVARAVLPKSPVLSTVDLLAIIASTGPEHHRLIAGRPGLSEEVVRALRIAGDRRAIATIDALDPPPQSAGGGPREARWRGQPSASPAPERSPLHTALARLGSHPRDEPAEDGASPASPASRARAGFDPWSFLDLDRQARLKVIADLARRPPVRRYAGVADRVDRAFRSLLTAAQIVSHARSGRHSQLVPTLAEATGMETSFVAASLADRTGEPLAVLLKSIGLDNVQAQQVFLLATATIGRDVNAFFRLADLYAGMEPDTAETLISIWRGERRTSPAHQPVFADNAELRRRAAEEPARARPAKSDERSKRA